MFQNELKPDYNPAPLQEQCVTLLQEVVPNMMSQESEVLQGFPGFILEKLSNDGAANSEDSASLFDAINQRFQVYPNMTS